MTTEQTDVIAAAEGDTADTHRLELDAARSKAAQVRYAARVLGPGATPPQARDWLLGYGIKVRTSTLYDNMPKAEGERAAGSGPDTTDLPKLTEERMAELATLEAEFARPESEPETGTEPETAAVSAPASVPTAPVPAAPVLAAPESDAPESESESGRSPEPESDTAGIGIRNPERPDPESEPDSESAPEPESESERKPESGIGVRPESGTGVRSVRNRNPEPESEPESAPVAERDGTADKSPAGAYGYYLVALVSLVISVDTSWRFFGEKVGITNLYERAAMFAILELALIAAGIGMAVSVRRTGKPGPSQLFAWGLAGFAGYMALLLSGPGVGIARLVLGPVIGLVSLHLALGIEKQARGDRAGVLSRIGGELRERLLALLHLADDERDAAQRTRDKASRDVAKLTFGTWVPFRQARLRRAIRISGAAHDPAQRERMLAELDAERYIGQLATLERPSPWV